MTRALLVAERMKQGDYGQLLHELIQGQTGDR